MLSQLWAELRAAISRQTYQSQRINELERLVRQLEQALRDARGG